MKYIILIFVSTIALTAVGCSQPSTENVMENATPVTAPEATPPADQPADKVVSVDFSQYAKVYNFSGKIPASWKVEYVSSTDSLNIYDPTASGIDTLEQSQIFMRHFKADSFLTLTTVNILSRQEATVDELPAVRYEIEKKSGISSFAGQPSWRSGRHKLIDIRSSSNSPTEFYVISYNPALDVKSFEDFIANLEFPK